MNALEERMVITETRTITIEHKVIHRYKDIDLLEQITKLQLTTTKEN